MDHQLNRDNPNQHNFQQPMSFQQRQVAYLPTRSLLPSTYYSAKCWKWKDCVLCIEKLILGYGIKQNIQKNQNCLFRHLSFLESEIEIKKRKHNIQEIGQLQKEFALILTKIFQITLQKITNGEERGKFSKLNTFFKRFIPRSNNASANLKQFHTIIKYIKQSSNIVPSLSNISNNVLSSKPYCQSSQCLNCITEFQKHNLILSNSNQTIVSLQTIDFNSNDVDRVLTDRISYMMNFQIGCLMIGAKKKKQQIFALGVVLSNRDKQVIYDKLLFIRNEYIFPQKTLGEKYQIGFIKVENGTSQQNLYIIRVYFESGIKKQTYFSIHKRKNVNGVQFSDFRVARGARNDQNYYEAQTIYKKVHIKYLSSLKVSPHVKMECKLERQEQFVYPMVVKAQQKKSLKNVGQYGNYPLKTLDNYQSILVLNNKESNYQNLFQDFIVKETKKGQIKYSQIYEKFGSSTQSLGRFVFYLEHRRKHNFVRETAKTIDVDKKVLVLLNIKNILALIKCEKFNEAYAILSSTYVPYFQTRITAFKCHEGNGQDIFYFQFENSQQSIFAFTLLQFKGIKSMFVGPNKIQNAIQTNLIPQQVNTQNQEYAKFDLLDGEC